MADKITEVREHIRTSCLLPAAARRRRVARARPGGAHSPCSLRNM